MKRLVAVCLLFAVLLLCSCTRYYAPGAGHGTRGPRLDVEVGPMVQVVAINASQQPIFVDLKGRRVDMIREFVQVNPGDSLIKYDRGFQNIRVTIAWWCEGCQDRVGYSQEQLFLSMPGLYTGKPIIITDLMLRNASMQRGIIINVGDPSVYTDDQGHYFVMDSNARQECTFASGPLQFFVRPATEAELGRKTSGRVYPYSLEEYKTHIDQIKGNVPFDGKLYDCRIVIHKRWRY